MNVWSSSDLETMFADNPDDRAEYDEWLDMMDEVSNPDYIAHIEREAELNGY